MSVIIVNHPGVVVGVFIVWCQSASVDVFFLGITNVYRVHIFFHFLAAQDYPVAQLMVWVGDCLRPRSSFRHQLSSIAHLRSFQFNYRSWASDSISTGSLTMVSVYLV